MQLKTGMTGTVQCNTTFNDDKLIYIIKDDDAMYWQRKNTYLES